MTNLIANVNKGLERIENHIRGIGMPMQNPANVIDGIRGTGRTSSYYHNFCRSFADHLFNFITLRKTQLSVYYL